MIGFGIDEIQAEYVAEIKLRHLNHEYIVNRLNEIELLETEIKKMEDILSDKKKIRKIIISELKDVIKKYSQPRRTMFYYKNDIIEEDVEDEIPDYPVNLFLSNSGYFKKITPQSLRMSGEQKLKEGDSITAHIEATNRTELLFFTDKCQVYKSRVSDFEDTKASLLGDYVPAKLAFDDDELLVSMISTADYSGKSKLCGIIYIREDSDILLKSTAGKVLIFNTALISPKATRDTIGVQVMTLRGKNLLEGAEIADERIMNGLKKYIVKNVPAAGMGGKDLIEFNQLSLNEE